MERPIAREFASEMARLASAADVAEYSPEAEALFARMDAQPSAEDKAFIDQWMTGDAAPFLAKLDCFYACLTSDVNTCLSGGKWLNWPNAAYDGTLVGTQNYIAPNGTRGGFKGDGSTFRVSTGFLPTGSTHYQESTGSIGFVISDRTAGELCSFGGYDVSNIGTRLSFSNSSGGNGNSRLNRNSARVFTFGTEEPAHLSLNRASSGEQTVWKNTTQLDTTTSSPASIAGWTTGDFNLFARYTGGSYATFGFQTSPAFWIGGDFSEAERTDWHYVLNELLAYFGHEPLQLRPQTFASIAMAPSNLEQSDTVTYTLSMRETGTRVGSIDVGVEGDMEDVDFDTPFFTSLATAVGGTTGVTLDGSTLTFASDFTGPLVWERELTSVPATGAVHGVRLSNEDGIYLECPFAAQIVGSPSLPSVPAVFKGVNLSGGEFGTAFYPDDAEVAVYDGLGADCIRLPCLWQRMQTSLFGAVAGTNANAYKAAVEVITARDMYCIIEPHNYGQYTTSAFKIGTPEVPVAAIVDFWEKFADFIGPNDKVIYNLMNEPNGMDEDTWRSAAKSIIDAIRAKGYFNLCLVPGTSYAGAHSHVSGGNDTRFADFTDPVGNWAFDMHQYLDADSSGTAGTCSVDAHERLEAATTACRGRGQKAFLGEYGSGDPGETGQEQCGTELPAMLAYMAANDDVWIGGAAWGGGRRWNETYILRFLSSEDNLTPTGYGAMVVAEWGEA